MKHRFQKPIIGVALGVALAATAGLGFQLWKPAAKRAATTTQADQAAAPPSRALVLGAASEQAAELDYAVEFQTDVRIGPRVASKLSGNFNLLLVERQSEQGNVVLSGKVRDPVVVVEEGDEATRDAVESGLNKDFEQTFALVLEPSGKVVRFGAGAKLSSGTESVLRAALSSLQYQAGPGGGAKTWSSVETDHYGTFSGGYRAISSDRLEKQKAYTELTLPAMLGSNDTSKASAKGQLSYVLAPQGHWPLRVDGKDELDTGLLRVAQRLTLTLQGRKAVPRERADFAGMSLSRLDRVVERAGTGAGSGYAKRLVAGASYQDIVGELSKLSDSDEDISKRHHVIRRLAALFELDPSAAQTAAKALREEPSGEHAEELLGALTSSKSAEARSEMNQLAADSSVPRELRSDALSGMTIQPRATAESFSTLTALASDPDPHIRNGAVLALGSTARSSGDDPALARESERASRSLQQGFNTAQTDEDRNRYLKALGNSGSAQALETAKVALQSPDPSLRREGVRALRLVPGDEADQLIARAWIEDEDPIVREAAPFAANDRALTPVLAQAAITSLAKDPNDAVRLRSLAFVAERMREYPDFGNAVRSAAQNDASPEVKRSAERYLASS